MGLKRLSNLFKRKDTSAETDAHLEVQRAASEQEQEAIGSMSTRFESMGLTMESIQDHLEGSTESIEQLPNLLREQHELCKQMTAAQETQHKLLHAVQTYFEERDASQAALLEHISQMNTQMRDTAQQHHQQVDTLVKNFRSGRNLLVIAIVFLVCISAVLLGLILIQALRPDIFAAPASTPIAQTQTQPTVSAAPTSNQQAIRIAPSQTLQPLVRTEPVSEEAPTPTE